MARGILPGSIAARWLTVAPASLTAPSQAELNAGVDVVGSELDEELAELNGWVVENNVIPTPGYNTNKVGNVGGDQTYPASSMAFYKDSVVETIFNALPDGTAGWMVIMDDGQGAGKYCETFPASVLTRTRSKDRGAKKFMVNFALNGAAIGTQGA